MSLNIEIPYNQGAGLYLPLTGGALTGPLALGANKITGLANGTAATDAATFGQMQTTEAASNPALQYNDLLGWTNDPSGPLGNGIMPTPAILYCGRIPLPVALTVTNVLAVLNILGATLTHSYLALFKSNGTVIGQSTNQSTAWEIGGATGLYTLPLVGGPYVCTPLAANDFVWAAVYVGTFGTGPTFMVPVTQQTIPVNAGTTVARSRFSYIGQADTATLGSIVPGNLTPYTPIPWMAIS